MLDSRNFVIRTLIADGQLTDGDLRRATEHSIASGGELLDSLVQLSIISSRRLAIAKAKICEYPFVDLTHYEIDFANARHLPRSVAERLNAFPIFVIDGVATVAMLDPLNLHAIDQVRQHLRCDVDPVQGDSEQLKALIARAYSLAKAVETEAQATGVAEVSLTTGDEPIVQAVNQILAGGAEAGASDVHISPDETALHLRYRVDGVLLPQQGPPKSAHEGMVQRLKVMAKLDLTQTRKPQDGKFRFKHKAEQIDVRLSVIPTIHGENVVMRLLRPAAKLGTVAELGMPQQMCAWFEEAVRKPHGMILVTGPTGSGKTTTLYTALNSINTPDTNIMTIEDPVEIRLPLVRQVQVNSEIGLTFATALRSILRQDPDVVLVGEVRDAETAKIAVQASMTGHLVLSTLHTNDAVGCINRLKDFELPTFAINAALLCTIAQRLVRRLCPLCAIPETDPTVLHAVHRDHRNTPFMAPAGCAECKQVGYRGRMGVYEMLRITPRVQQLIEAQAGTPQITAAARADGMRSLWEDGVEKAARRETSLQEALSLRAEFDDASAQSERRAA
ncbi:MAG: GspE/PulE family protein [Phycisphaerales bacterium]